MKYKLKKPIKLGEAGELISELVFREEMTAGDMRGIPVRDPMNFEDVCKIAGRLTGQPDAVINRLSIADTGEVVRIVGGFLNAGQETGVEPSQS